MTTIHTTTPTAYNHTLMTMLFFKNGPQDAGSHGFGLRGRHRRAEHGGAAFEIGSPADWGRGSDESALVYDLRELLGL